MKIEGRAKRKRPHYDELAVQLAVQLAGCFTGYLASRLTGCLAGHLTDCVADRPTGYRAGCHASEKRNRNATSENFIGAQLFSSQ